MSDVHTVFNVNENAPPLQERASRLVGHLKVPAMPNHLVTFEYAGAGEIWNLDAAIIPIFKVDPGPTYWFVGKRPGVRIDKWFQNRIGATYGSDNRDRAHVRGFVGIQFDAYTAGTYAAAGDLALEEGWTFKQVGQYSPTRHMYRVEHG